MSDLTIEVVEGPDAGRQVSLRGPLVIGRGGDADLVLSDSQVSRRHARVSPSGSSAVVEDLGSSNGTFVNHAELHTPARLDPGDDLLAGVTVMQLRTAREVASQPSAVRPVPPGLADAEPPGDHTPPPVAARGATPGPPELTGLLDVYTKTRAKTAPVAILALVALALILYLATR
jgi:pSer/pThr/pTyr-binding forkhead associated (FHA) protein